MTTNAEWYSKGWKRIADNGEREGEGRGILLEKGVLLSETLICLLE